MSAINANDFIVGFDPTSSTNITGAQLAQLINSAYPQVDKGMCILTIDIAGNPVVPAADTTTKWQRYLWIRQSVSSVSTYVWNAGGATDATFLNWISISIAGIGAGSIVNSMIQDNTITDSKIAGLSYSKLYGVPSAISASTAATGDLLGSTFGNPVIANYAITTGKIALNSIGHSQLAAQAVQPITDILPNGNGLDMLRTNAGATAMEFFTPNDMVKATTAQIALAGNGSRVPRVTAGATAFEMVSVNDTVVPFGRILQVVDTFSPNKGATNYTTAPTARPTLAAALTTTNLLLGFSTVAFTPKSATSTIVVELLMNLAGKGGNVNAIAALLDTRISSTNMVAGAVGQSQTSGVPMTVSLKYTIASWGTGISSVYSAYYGSTSNDCALNSTDGSTDMFNSLPTLKSHIRITEYI